MGKLIAETEHQRVYVNTYRCKQCVCVTTVQEIQSHPPKFCVWCGAELARREGVCSMNVNRAAIMYDMAELEAWIAIDPNPSDEKLAIVREALARLDALAAPKESVA